MDGSGKLDRFRPWLYAAAAYNLIWGMITILFPEAWFELLGVDPGGSLVFWQLAGMFVLVFAPAYWWAARAPERHAHLVAVGLLGKTLGVIGLVGAVAAGRLDAAFAPVIVLNDIIWIPAFAAFVREAAVQRGLRAFLAGA
jgi:small multidrug resistance pump